jgi:serine phosphatase RsbU (regulator of sigma subunit)
MEAVKMEVVMKQGTKETQGNREIIEWSVTSLPARGQVESGDSYVVKRLPNGVLIAVIDGLGHGPDAAAVSRLTAKTLEDYASGQSLTALLEDCHERLRGTRGAVISLALLDAGRNTISWLGVGGIEGLLLRRQSRNGKKQQEMLLLRAGVVGHQLPMLAIHTLPLHAGDIVVFATDGIRPEFADNIDASFSPLMIANDILERYALETDDALVLVVRYLHDQNSRNYA